MTSVRPSKTLRHNSKVSFVVVKSKLRYSKDVSMIGQVPPFTFIQIIVMLALANVYSSVHLLFVCIYTCLYVLLMVTHHNASHFLWMPYKSAVNSLLRPASALSFA